MCANKIVIGLGSNIGNRAENLSHARELIEKRIGKIEQQSSITETESWGFSAPPFLNQAIVISSEMEPLELLDALQEIEKELGRTEKTKIVNGHPVYSSRTIDLDILDYDNMQYNDERLTLPHPKIAFREFVMDELKELGLLNKILRTPEQNNDTI